MLIVCITLELELWNFKKKLPNMNIVYNLILKKDESNALKEIIIMFKSKRNLKIQ